MSSFDHFFLISNRIRVTTTFSWLRHDRHKDWYSIHYAGLKLSIQIKPKISSLLINYFDTMKPKKILIINLFAIFNV